MSMLEKEFIFDIESNLNDLKENKINDFLYGLEMSQEMAKHLGLSYARPVQEDWGYLTHLKEIFPGVHINLCLVGQPVDSDTTKINKASCILQYRASLYAQLSTVAGIKAMFNTAFEKSIAQELVRYEFKIESFLKSKNYKFKTF